MVNFLKTEEIKVQYPGKNSSKEIGNQQNIHDSVENNMYKLFSSKILKIKRKYNN